MAEPQKVSSCKYCGQEITWNQDPVSGKNYPKNLNGSPHLCKKEAAPAQGRAPVTDIAGDAVEKAKERMAKAGFGQPAGGNTTDCTSPKTPAGEFWNVLGVVESLDALNRKATVSDEHGIIHPLTWAAGYLDEKFAKLKPGYYRKFSGESTAPDVVTAIGYMGKDADPEWAKARYKALHPPGSVGGWKAAPRNERIIVVECMLKAYCELWCSTNTPDQVTFADAREDILKAVEQDLPRVLKAGGV